MPGITLLGLGPGDPKLLTREAWAVLSGASEVYLRTRRHPTVAGFPTGITIHSFDDLYERGESFEKVYEAIVTRVLELGRRPQGVIYAVPGHPFIAEATGPEIARRARDEGLSFRLVEGLSFLEPVFSALGVDPYPHTALVDALELSMAHVPPFPPDVPALIAQIDSRLVAAEVKMTLGALYPDEHPVRLVHAAGTSEERVEDLSLYEIDRSEHIGFLTCLYLPPLGEGTSFEAFQEIVAHLRAPDGCPWDRQQTHQSLRTHLLEEAYEALTAIDREDEAAMREEFGDLLLQIVLQAQIAGEEGAFTMSDVLRDIHAKIVRRHPHVFGDLEVKDVDRVLLNWEKLKEAEREANGEAAEKGLLDGVPLALPALTQAQEYQARAARVGFDWPEIGGVLEKIAEEIREVQQAEDGDALAAEIGDLLFALVNLARWKGVDAESALREANARFKARFAYIERGAQQQGKRLSDLTLDEMEALWQEAKRKPGS
ncbi:MAG: nucleoside triphosphate pyrophosphohydrolase [Anaerolineae bacterium]|nr:MAG: nucleoside triphosphate pyrophosphohydrolase [Anaerolineae bacterium]